MSLPRVEDLTAAQREAILDYKRRWDEGKKAGDTSDAIRWFDDLPTEIKNLLITIFKESGSPEKLTQYIEQVRNVPAAPDFTTLDDAVAAEEATAKEVVEEEPETEPEPETTPEAASEEEGAEEAAALEDEDKFEKDDEGEERSEALRAADRANRIIQRDRVPEVTEENLETAAEENSETEKEPDKIARARKMYRQELKERELGGLLKHIRNIAQGLPSQPTEKQILAVAEEAQGWERSESGGIPSKGVKIRLYQLMIEVIVGDKANYVQINIAARTAADFNLTVEEAVEVMSNSSD